jgi:hypothetical protein
MEVCQVCQVEKHGLVFKTKRDRANNTTSSPDFIRTRICVHAKSHGCINREGQINTALKYNDLGATVEEWLGSAKELMNKYKITSQP